MVKMQVNVSMIEIKAAHLIQMKKYNSLDERPDYHLCRH